MDSIAALPDVRFGCHRGSARMGTILLRDLWSGSYQVTPSWRAASRQPLVDKSAFRAHPKRAAGKEMSQTSSDVTRTLPTNRSPKRKETPVVL